MRKNILTKWFMFLFWNVFFSIVTKGACDDNILETTIVNEENEEISFRWVETEPLLANNHLPIWSTESPSDVKQDLDVMEQIGHFRTYHDLEKSSAIVLIEKWNCIFGVIDVRYTIACLPLNQLHGYKHKLGESRNLILVGDQGFLNFKKRMGSPGTPPKSHPATTSHKTANNYKMLIKTYVYADEVSMTHLTSNRADDRAAPSSLDGQPPSKRPRLNWNYEEQVITVYPEILIFISHEIVSITKYLTTLVLTYIVQFNAVAMLYAKLETDNVKIHINMAGLVIEKHPKDFPSTPLFDNGRPSGRSVLDSITEYIKDVRRRQPGSPKVFAQDSVDMFILSTMNEWKEREVNAGGMSTEVFDLMETRKTHTPMNNKKFLGSIVDATKSMQYYVNVAREIAHLMTVENDPPHHASCRNTAKCHAIMQGSWHSPDCLTWSHQSIKSFKRYLSENTNRCFLRNLPRSLHPYDRPIKSLIPADQCLCYGYFPDWETTHLDKTSRFHICKQTLKCLKSLEFAKLQSVTVPMDGTPCDVHDGSKVCWRQVCVSTVPTLLRSN